MSAGLNLFDDASRERIIGQIRTLDLTKPWVIKIERRKAARSLNQNALFHKWVGIIADDIGDDPDSVKETLKDMFAPRYEHENKITGEIELLPKGTSQMTVAEMSEFMTKIQGWAWSFQAIGLPSPEDMLIR